MATLVRAPTGRLVRTPADRAPQPADAVTPQAAGRPTAATLRLQRGAGNQAIQRFVRARAGAELRRDATNDAAGGEGVAAGTEGPTGALSGAERLAAPAPEAVRADRQAPRESGAKATDPTRAAQSGALDAASALANMAAPRLPGPVPDEAPPTRAPVRPALRVTSDPASLQAQTASAIGQLPRPSLGNYTAAQAAIRARGFHSAATYAAARAAASSGPSRAQAAAVPVSDPVKPSEPDPSPKTTKEIRKKSGRALDKIEAPDVQKPPSPQLHVPDLARVSQEGYKPISSQDFHALMAIAASDRVIASLTDEERALLKTDLERLNKLRQELLAPPEPEPATKPKTKDEKKKEERQRVIEDVGAPAPLAVGEEDKGKLAAVFARLLAESDVTAEAIMHKIRQSVPAIGFGLDQKVPTLGNPEHKTAVRAEVDKRIEQLRDAAGITKEELDKKIAERRAELEKLRAQAAAGTQATTSFSLQPIETEGQKTDAATAAARKGAEKKAEKVRKAAEKAKLPMDVGSRRTRLLVDTTRVITEQSTAYKQRLELHTLRLGGLARRMNLAYRYAAQQDELQIATRAGKNAATEAVAAETQKTRVWLAEREKGTQAFADERKKAAQAQSAIYQTELHTAGDARREALRAWADTKLKTNRTAQQKDQQRAADAAEQTRAEAAAWEKVQNQRSVEGMLGQHGDFAAVKKMAQEVKGRQDRDAYIEKEHLSADQQAVLDAYLGVLDPDDVSAIVMKGEDKETNGVTAGMLIRLGQVLGEKIAPKMEDYLLAQHGAEWPLLNELGSLQDTGRSEPFEATKIGNRVRDAVDRIGTKEQWIFTALDKLSKLQIQAVRSYYLDRFKTTIDADLEDDMSGRELQRAKALLEGQSFKADAIGLRQAMKGNWEGALGGIGSISGAGTDEDAMHEIMRNRSPEERAAVIRAYNEMFDPALKALIDKAKTQEERDKIYAQYAKEHPSKLLADAKDEMDGERDGERFEAEAAGNDDLADAIELRDVLPTPDIVNAPNAPPIQADHDRVTAIYDRIRREVSEQGRKGHWTQSQIEGEIARRSRAVEAHFDAKYAKDYQVEGSSKGALRTAFDVGFKVSPEKANLANALADNDVARADAARVRIEHKGVWASDDVLNEILEKQYNRALEANRRDEMPLRGMLMARQLTDMERKDIAAGNGPWTGARLWEERERLQRKMDRTLEQGAREQAKGNMLALRAAYARDYHADLDKDIEADTSGYSGRKAKALLEQDGYLTPAQTVFYAIRGTGTDEAALKRALEGRTAAEIEEMRKEFKELALKDNTTALGAFNSMFDSAFEDRTDMDAQIAADLSGREGFDIGQLLKGTPETIDQKRQRLVEAINYERDVGPMGSALAGDAVTALDKNLAHLDATIKKLNDPRLTPAQREMYLGFYEQNIQTVEEGIQQHRRELDTWVDRITTAIGMVIALATIAIVSFFTLGAGGVVLVSLLGSILATASTMAVKGAILGGQYGWEDIGVDIAVGIADALLAAVTAGMGEKLMGLAKAGAAAGEQLAAQGAKKMLFQGLRMRGADFFKTGAGRLINPSEGMLTRMIPTSSALKEMVERGGFSKLLAFTLAEGAESLAQSSGSALMSTALNEQTWEQGNPLKNLALGTLQQSATSAAIGLGVSSLHKLGARAIGHARSALTTLRDPATVAHLEWREFNRLFPDVPHEEFVQARRAADLELEVRRASEGPPAQPARGEGVPREAAGTTERVELEGPHGTAEARLPGDPPPPRPLTEADVRELMPPDIRERVPVSVDPNLKGRQVKVEFTRRLGGLSDIRIVAAPNARPIDIMLHAPTVYAMRRYSGLGGRVVALIERLRFWFVKNGVPPLGTRAWEAHFELNKLPMLIEARLQLLAAGGLDMHAQGQLLADIARLSAQIDVHTATLNRMDLSPGEGYVAVGDLDAPPAPVKEAQHPRSSDPSGWRGDLKQPRYPVDDSPLLGTHEKVYQVGPAWKTIDGRTYRLVEAVDGNGRRLRVREEIQLQTRGRDNGRWVQRGQESNQTGRVGEMASELKTKAEAAAAPRGEKQVAIAKALLQNPSGHGFDQVVVKFVKGEAKIYIIEDKNYPNRYVPLEDFTAITGRRLRNNLETLTKTLERKTPAELGMTAHEKKLLMAALEDNNIAIEIRTGPDTFLGAEGPGRVISAIKDGAERLLKRPVEVTRRPIERRYERRAIAALQRADKLGQTARQHELAETKSGARDGATERQARSAVLAERSGAGITDGPLERGRPDDVFVDRRRNRFIAMDGHAAKPRGGARALAADMVDRLLEPKPPRSGKEPTRILLDVTTLSKTERAALRARLLEEARRRNARAVLDDVLLVDHRTQTVEPLFAAGVPK